MTPNGSGSGAGGNANLYGSSFMPMPAACTIQALQVSTLQKPARNHLADSHALQKW